MSIDFSFCIHDFWIEIFHDLVWTRFLISAKNSQMPWHFYKAFKQVSIECWKQSILKRFLSNLSLYFFCLSGKKFEISYYHRPENVSLDMPLLALSISTRVIVIKYSNLFLLFLLLCCVNLINSISFLFPSRAHISSSSSILIKIDFIR